MAGYSSTPLIKKLGIKPDSKMLFINEPASIYKEIGTLPQNDSDVASHEFDYIHFFTKDKKDLELFFTQIKKILKKSGILWVSWPKKSSLRLRSGQAKLKSDVNENVVRKIGLAAGLVDVKVTAIDTTWSGLKFVFRVKNR